MSDTPFLHFDSIAEPLRRDGLVIESVRFDLDKYDASLYRKLGIAMPGKLRGAVAKRQAEFLAGRYCAARALSAAGAESTEVLSGDNRVPSWPVNTVGSISHTAGRAMAVASLDRNCLGVGVDCESLISSKVAERIYNRIATQADASLQQHTDWSKETFLTLAFSAKESLYKALYPTVGRFFGFDSAQLLRLQDGKFTIALTRDLNEQWRSGQQFEGCYTLGDEFAVTLLEVTPKSL